MAEEAAEVLEVVVPDVEGEATELEVWDTEELEVEELEVEELEGGEGGSLRARTSGAGDRRVGARVGRAQGTQTGTRCRKEVNTGGI